MDRDILFRGKEIRYGRWIEGYYNRTWLTNGEIITEIREVERPHHMQEFIEVDPASVGQYTGLADKNGKRIFEGDVMNFHAYGFHYRGVVSFEEGNFCIICNNPNASPFLDSAIKAHDAVCVGNIHDDPELLR